MKPVNPHPVPAASISTFVMVLVNELFPSDKGMGLVQFFPSGALR